MVSDLVWETSVSVIINRGEGGMHQQNISPGPWGSMASDLVWETLESKCKVVNKGDEGGGGGDTPAKH